MANFLDPRLPACFWSQVQPCPMSGCWLWTGTEIGGGYGRTKSAGRGLLVHRHSYGSLVGPIPDGLVIDHLCRVRCCVNPAHLEPVTQQVNVRRSDSQMARRAAQTHCKRGHELAGDNLKVFERSPNRFMRTCITCERAASVLRRNKPTTKIDEHDAQPLLLRVVP